MQPNLSADIRRRIHRAYVQMMEHTVNNCPLTRFPGGQRALHQADERAVSWLSLHGKRHKSFRHHLWTGLQCLLGLRTLHLDIVL